MPLALAIGHEIVQALSFAAGTGWEILWALILGFALSGVVQAVVTKREMRRLMPDDSPRTLAVASGLVMDAYQQVGISLPHYTGSQWAMGMAVPRDELEPGRRRLLQQHRPRWHLHRRPSVH